MTGAYDTATGVEAPGWLADAINIEARERIRNHPAFSKAMARSAAELVGFYSGNRLLNRVLNDRGRLLFGFFALYLHALPEERGGGLTVSHMAALAAETDVCSRGRAKAMLALLRWGGYLEPAESAADRRVKPLVPTARMFNQQLQRWQMQFQVLSAFEPEVSEVEAALLDRAVFDAVILAFGDAFRSGYRVLHHAPQVAEIADRDSGLMILLALYVAEEKGEAIPAIAELARRFHVSRAHVLQLLKDAMGAGLLVRDSGGGAGRLTERGYNALADFFTSSFAFLLGTAHAARQKMVQSAPEEERAI